jgi:hypothetical protein
VHCSGDLDLAVGNEGADQLLRNDGGSFTSITLSGKDTALTTTDLGWLDADGDALPELVIVCAVTPPPPPPSSPPATPPLPPSAPSPPASPSNASASTGPFPAASGPSGDPGATAVTGGVFLLSNLGGGSFSLSTIADGFDGTALTIGDIDGDGV